MAQASSLGAYVKNAVGVIIEVSVSGWRCGKYNTNKMYLWEWYTECFFQKYQDCVHGAILRAEICAWVFVLPNSSVHPYFYSRLCTRVIRNSDGVITHYY